MAKSKTGKPVTWVVYKRVLIYLQQETEFLAIRTQAEWEKLDGDGPGIHTLVQGGFATEADAEKFARGTSGDDYRKRSGPKK